MLYNIDVKRLLTYTIFTNNRLYFRNNILETQHRIVLVNSAGLFKQYNAIIVCYYALVSVGIAACVVIMFFIYRLWGCPEGGSSNPGL